MLKASGSSVDHHFHESILPQTPSPSPYSFFFGLIWREFRLRALALGLLSVAGMGLMGLEPLLLRDLINSLQSNPTDGQAAMGIFYMVVGVWFASMACNRLQDWVEMHTSPQLRLRAQAQLYAWLEGHSPSFFQTHMTGNLAQKVKQAGTAVLSLLDIIFNHFVRLLVAVAMAAVVLSNAPAHFFWSFMVWLVLFLAVSWWFAKRVLPLSKAFGEAASHSSGILADITSHMDAVRANARQGEERERFLEALASEKAASMRTRRFLLLMMLGLYTALLGFQAIFIGLGVRAYLAGEVSLGDVVMMVSLSAILVTNIWGMSQQLQGFYDQTGVLQAALSIVSQPHAVREAPNALPLRVSGGEIVFESVRYGHDPHRPLFKNLNLRVAAGEKVGLVGPSGAGKSSLIKLLRRHQDLSGGRILIDGQDIAGVTFESLNKAIADVPQEPAMFHRSLRENITYARPEVSEAELQRAVSLAHCEPFIGGRAEGLEAIVGERGLRLSGGERQRVALARAFIKDAPILLLDEATSALDSQSERLIQDALLTLCQGRTVIAIAHRLSTLRSMDRIVVLDHGAIVEEGTHDQLLLAGGLYSRLWQQEAHGGHMAG